MKNQQKRKYHHFCVESSTFLQSSVEIWVRGRVSVQIYLYGEIVLQMYHIGKKLFDWSMPVQD